MKSTKFIGSGFLFMVAFIFSASFSSCSGKKTENRNLYPKEVMIQYKVTSTSGLSTANIIYTNETGGNTSLSNQSLPFTISFKRIVKQYDIIALTGSVFTSGSLKFEILIDGTLVDSKTATGTNSVSGSAGYAFQ